MERTGTGHGEAGDTGSPGRSLPAGAAQQPLQAGERRAAVGPGPVVSRLHRGRGRRLVPRADGRRPTRHRLGGREVRSCSGATPRSSPLDLAVARTPEPVERLGQRGENARGKTPRDGGARLEATPSEAGGGASETRAKFRKRRGGA